MVVSTVVTANKFILMVCLLAKNWDFFQRNIFLESYLYDWWRVGSNLAFEGCWATLIHKLISHWLNELWCLGSSHWCNRFDGWLNLSLYEEFSGASGFSHLVHNDAIVCSFVLFFDLNKSNSISENVCSNCTAIICQTNFLNDSNGNARIQQLETSKVISAFWFGFHSVKMVIKYFDPQTRRNLLHRLAEWSDHPRWWISTWDSREDAGRPLSSTLPVWGNPWSGSRTWLVLLP